MFCFCFSITRIFTFLYSYSKSLNNCAQTSKRIHKPNNVLKIGFKHLQWGNHAETLRFLVNIYVHLVFVLFFAVKHTTCKLSFRLSKDIHCTSIPLFRFSYSIISLFYFYYYGIPLFHYYYYLPLRNFLSFLLICWINLIIISLFFLFFVFLFSTFHFLNPCISHNDIFLNL